MLRGLVLLLLVANVVVYFWIRTDPAWTLADREPQRRALQVSPQRVTYSPDLPWQQGGKGASAPVSDAADAASSPASVPVPAASASSPAPAASGATVVAACLESAPLAAAEAAALQRTLGGAGVPASAITLRPDPQSQRWMVYMGRFADTTQAQHKAEELRNLHLDYAPVGSPPALAPGLSLGVFNRQANADARLAELGRRGVHTARIVTLDGDSSAKRVQVKPVDPAWRKKLPAERFADCGP